MWCNAKPCHRREKTRTCFLFIFLSVEQDDSRILNGTVPERSEGGAENVALAKVEVGRLLEVSDSSMLAVCQKIEQASSKGALEAFSVSSTVSTEFYWRQTRSGHIMISFERPSSPCM